MGNPQVTIHLLGESTYIKFLRHLEPQGAANLAEFALCRALEVPKYVYVPSASHLRQPWQLHNLGYMLFLFACLCVARRQVGSQLCTPASFRSHLTRHCPCLRLVVYVKQSSKVVQLWRTGLVK